MSGAQTLHETDGRVLAGRRCGPIAADRHDSYQQAIERRLSTPGYVARCQKLARTKAARCRLIRGAPCPRRAEQALGVHTEYRAALARALVFHDRSRTRGRPDSASLIQSSGYDVVICSMCLLSPRAQLRSPVGVTRWLRRRWASTSVQRWFALAKQRRCPMISWDTRYSWWRDLCNHGAVLGTFGYKPQEAMESVELAGVRQKKDFEELSERLLKFRVHNRMLLPQHHSDYCFRLSPRGSKKAYDQCSPSRGAARCDEDRQCLGGGQAS